MTDFGIAQVARGAGRRDRRPAPSSAPATTSRPSRRRAAASTSSPTSTRSGSSSTRCSPARCRSPATTSSRSRCSTSTRRRRPSALLRPEVPRRVEAAIERALAKEPSERFYSMADFCAELEACLAELRAGDEDGTATGVMPAIGRRRKARTKRRRSRWRPSGRRQSRWGRTQDRRAKQRGSEDPRSREGSPEGRRRSYLRRRWALLVLVLVVAAAVAAGVVASLHSGGGSSLLGGGSKPMPLKAVAAYDPDGSPPGQENNQLVPRATDASAATFWATEIYRYPDGGLGKPGVGIVFDGRLDCERPHDHHRFRHARLHGGDRGRQQRVGAVQHRLVACRRPGRRPPSTFRAHPRATTSSGSRTAGPPRPCTSTT